MPALACPEPRRGEWGLLLRSPLSRARAIDDKYSRREEYRGFTQDFKEKDGYKPDVKIEYVDETGRKLTPKEVRAPLRQGRGGRAAWQGMRETWRSTGSPVPRSPSFSSRQQFPSQGWQEGQTGASVPLPTCPLSGLTCS